MLSEEACSSPHSAFSLSAEVSPAEGPTYMQGWLYTEDSDLYGL